MIFEKGRLSSQLLRWFLLIGLIPLFLVTFLTYRNSVKFLKDEAYYALSSVASRQIKQISIYILERQRDVATLAKTPFTGEAIEDLILASKEHGYDSPEFEDLTRSYRSFFAYYTESAGYHDLFLISREGDVLFTVGGGPELGQNLESGDLADTSLAQVFTKASTFLEPTFPNFDNYPPLGDYVQRNNWEAAPVFKDNLVVGAVALLMNNEDAYRIINDYTGLGRTGETVVGALRECPDNENERQETHAPSRVSVNPEPCIVFLAPTRHDPDAAFNRFIPLGEANAKPLQAALGGEKGSGISVDYRGESVLAIWRYFPLGWGMVVKIDADEAFAPVARLRNLSFLIAFLTLGAVVLTAQSIARSLSEPIQKLTNYTQLISEGDLDQTIEIEVENEIGILASSFNRMTAQLKDSIRELRETTAAQERIESELRVASDIQMSTMPKIFPPFPERKDFGIHATIKPAREVGGDFFNFELIKDDRLFFVIGDVSGKGVHAALFMAVANTLIQTAARAGLTPDEVLGVANRQLSRDNDTSMFVTVFCGVVDLGNGCVTFSNGGHNPPYLLSEENGITPLDQAPGLVLGLDPDFEYSSHTLTLRSGEGLFLYTDGVTEAMDHDDQLFGESRVESFLDQYQHADAKKIVEGALGHVEDFTAGAPQSDDITLLAFRYRPPVPPS